MTKTKFKTVYKLKWKNALKLFGVLIAIVALFGIGTAIYTLLRDRVDVISITEDVKEKANVTPIVDDEDTKTVKPDSKLSKFDAYWNYIKLSLLDVDMAALKRINTDSIGYVEIKGTDFSYPVVQGGSFYKKHSFLKKDNIFGWIYLDSKADVDNPDTNTILYGNKVWFGVLADNLKQLYKDEWKANIDNYIIKYTTNHSAGLYQIISVYETKNKDHLKTNFETEDETKEFIKNSISNSKIKFKANALPTDKFLTITTNSNGNNIVVLAKLIKYKDTK